MADRAAQVADNARTLAQDNQSGGWERLWKAGSTPWDNGTHQPALDELLDRAGDVVPTSGAALVPGCGSGFDAVRLAAHGLDVTGLDVSETAVAAANARFGDRERVRFVAGDFFAYTPPTPLALCYDYTFVCALPPEYRPRIARKYADLLAPGALLATLIFPIDGDRDGGPPYSLSVELFDEHFGPYFERLLLFQPASTAGIFKGRELRAEQQRMALWRRRA